MQKGQSSINLFSYYFRVISRAPGLKIVVETLISSLKPIGNIVLIAATFFIIFGILGVQVKICKAKGHFLINLSLFLKASLGAQPFILK